eukprot:jgi/Mesen1/974/ME000012S00517
MAVSFSPVALSWTEVLDKLCTASKLSSGCELDGQPCSWLGDGCISVRECSVKWPLKQLSLVSCKLKVKNSLQYHRTGKRDRDGIGAFTYSTYSHGCRGVSGSHLEASTTSLPEHLPTPLLASTKPDIDGKVESIAKQPNVVITGGTKGLGFAMAREFLQRGYSVIICGRNEERLEAAVERLGGEFLDAKIFGAKCDVSSADDVTALGTFIQEHAGTVKYWINNAGEVTAKQLLTDIPAADIIRVASTNVIGTLLCCREALRVMTQQPGSSAADEPLYHIFNMGFTKWGAKFTKSACTHKSTKVALTQLTAALNEDLKAAGVKSVGVHNLSPGLVLTDLLLKDSTPGARRFFNTIAEEADTVAAELVPKILAVEGSGKSIAYLSPLGAFTKVITRVPQIINGGRFFDKEGNRVAQNGVEYEPNGVRKVFTEK